MDNKELAKISKLHKQYMRLYEGNKVVAFGWGYVQINEKSLYEIFSNNPGSAYVTSERKRDKEYPFEISIVIDGTKFLSIGTRKDFESVGFKID